MEPTSVNASGDYYRNLKLGTQESAPVVRQSSTDRLADFFYVLKGSEGTLRNWRTRTPKDRMIYLNAIEKPKDPEAEKLWRTEILGILFMELSEPGGDPMVAQAVIDSLRDAKVGKR